MIRRICYFIIFISSICFLFSCSGNKKTDLDLPIDEDTMVNIIKDMQKAKFITIINVKDSALVNEFNGDYKKSICNHYNTDTQTYDSCLSIYLQHGDIMKKILQKAKQ